MYASFVSKLMKMKWLNEILVTLEMLVLEIMAYQLKGFKNALRSNPNTIIKIEAQYEAA